jgi:hypothetical protein
MMCFLGPFKNKTPVVMGYCFAFLRENLMFISLLALDKVRELFVED